MDRNSFAITFFQVSVKAMQPPGFGQRYLTWRMRLLDLSVDTHWCPLRRLTSSRVKGRPPTPRERLLAVALNARPLIASVRPVRLLRLYETNVRLGSTDVKALRKIRLDESTES
jgi:hypothetical protein